MTSNGIVQILVFFGLILLVTKPVGLFMARLFQGERTFLHPILRPLEVLVYKLCGVREDQEQPWTQYAASLLSFSLFSFVFVYVFQRLQGHLPLNPQGFGAAQVPPDLSFNTAMSFMTNTNWQAYSGESTLSYLVQMAALAVQNFVSAAAGLAVLVGLGGLFVSPEVLQTMPLAAKLIVQQPVISGGLTLVILHSLLCPAAAPETVQA